MYGCAHGRRANCRMLEGIIESWCFPIIEDKEEELSLNKVQTKKRSSCVMGKEQGAEHAQSLFIAHIVKVESLDQDFCEAGIRCCASQSQTSGSGSWFAATALGSPAQSLS